MAPALDAIRSDSSATFIPVVDDRGLRRLRAPGPAQADTEDGETPSGAILARVTSTGESPLASPPSLGLDFVADGVLSSEHLAGVGAVLGIRPYLTDVILDALAAHRDESADPLESSGSRGGSCCVSWQVLGHHHAACYLNLRSRPVVLEHAEWEQVRLRPDRRATSPRARPPTPPTLAGGWRPASELAFGKEWAEWLELGEDRLGPASRQRAEAYRDLQAIAPGNDALVAAPSVLAGLLPLLDEDVSWAESDAGPQLPDDPDERHVSCFTRSCCASACGRSADPGVRELSASSPRGRTSVGGRPGMVSAPGSPREGPFGLRHVRP